MTTTSLRVVIVEDSAILGDGLARLLADRGHEVVAQVGDAQDLDAVIADTRPDVAVVDVRLPPTFTDEGMVAAIALRRRRPDVGLLVFSQWVETRHATELIADDASGVGYLLKDRVANVGEFVDALQRVAGGGTALDPDVVGQLVGASRRRDALSRLTAREREVLELMTQGLSNTAIAETLVISGRAAEKHVGNIFTKLDLPPSAAQDRRVMAVLRAL